MKNGVLLLNFIVFLAILSMFGLEEIKNKKQINNISIRYLFSIVIAITHSSEYPENFIKGKICMLKDIVEFSTAFQEKNDTREFSLKYKLLMISLMCLFESSNQYFFYSAR